MAGSAGHTARSQAARLAATLVVTLAVAVATTVVPLPPASAQSGGLQAANVALVRARSAARDAFLTVLVERDRTEQARRVNELAQAASSFADAELEAAVNATREAERTMRAIVVHSYVSGGTVDTLASVLTEGTATVGPGLGRMYSVMSQQEAVARLRQAQDDQRAAQQRADEARETATQTADAFDAQLQAEQRADQALVAAQSAVVARSSEQARAMAAVWGGVGGSPRCDGGGRPGTVDTIGSVLASRQAGQGFDRSREGRLLPPVRNALPGSPLGWRQDPIEPETLAWHQGIDIDASSGTPVLAVTGGVVVMVGDADDGYGSKVVVDHGGGLGSVYAHLSSVSVGVGQIVGEGQVVGGVGSTGRSTGPHLHFELRTFGAQCDPMWGWGAG